VALVAAALWVYGAGPGEWASRLASFKAWAVAITVAYFVAGIAFMNENEKRRSGGRA
jgi:hypothetical protein